MISKSFAGLILFSSVLSATAGLWGASEGQKEHPIKRVSFDEVETMSGRKVVLFISNSLDAPGAKSSVDILRGVRDRLVKQDAVKVPVSFVRVDCGESANKEKCKVAKFTDFPRWFLHTEQGGIEDLWNPLQQTAETIVEYFNFRTSSEPVPNAAVYNLRHFSSLTDLATIKPVVLCFEMPWSGKSKRFQRHFDMVSSKFSSDFSFFRVDCEKMRVSCTAQTIESYPTVALYFQNEKGQMSKVGYNGRESFMALEEFLSSRKSVKNLLNDAGKVNASLYDTATSSHDQVEELLTEFEDRFKTFMKVGFKTVVSKISKKVDNALKGTSKGFQPKSQ